MKKIFTSAAVVLLGIVFIGATFEILNNYTILKADKKIQKEFTVKPNGKVIFDLENGGSIEIEGWSKNIVAVNAQLNGRDVEDIQVEITQDGNEINISSYYNGNSRNRSSKEKYFVNVPDKFNVEFETMGGDIKINNVAGDFEGKTMGGQINLSKLKGEVDMTTMGGRINVADCDVNGKVKTMGGEVVVENVNGDLDASSMGGKVTQKNVKGNNNSIGKEVNISTMGGEINVDNAPNGAKVKTMGGDITINSAAKFVNAVTYGGDIEIKEVDGEITAKTFGGDVDVNFIGKGENKDIMLTSLGGDINLKVPQDFSMNIYVEIAYTKDWGRKHKNFEDLKVSGDFNLSEERSSEWDDSHGSPRKYYKAKGSVNGGSNKVVIKTINGNVSITKN